MLYIYNIVICMNVIESDITGHQHRLENIFLWIISNNEHLFFRIIYVHTPGL